MKQLLIWLSSFFFKLDAKWTELMFILMVTWKEFNLMQKPREKNKVVYSWKGIAKVSKLMYFAGPIFISFILTYLLAIIVVDI